MNTSSDTKSNLKTAEKGWVPEVFRTSTAKKSADATNVPPTACHDGHCGALPCAIVTSAFSDGETPGGQPLKYCRYG